MNYIIKAISKSAEENWEDHIWCTTCGARPLMDFLHWNVLNNLRRNGEIIRDRLYYSRRMDQNLKSKFILNICEELNGIDTYFSTSELDFEQERVLDRILFEVFWLLGRRENRLLNLLNGRGLAHRLFVKGILTRVNEDSERKHLEEEYRDAVDRIRVDKRLRSILIEAKVNKRVSERRIKTFVKKYYMESYLRKKNRNLLQDI